MSQTTHLPTPRTHLTSLLTTLFTSTTTSKNHALAQNTTPININTNTNTLHPHSQNSNQNHSTTTSKTNPPYSLLKSHGERGEGAKENPFRTLSPNQKALLSTLHVVFPPPMLLQALDLLDRGFVSVFTLGEGEEQEDVVEGGGKEEVSVDENSESNSKSESDPQKAAPSKKERETSNGYRYRQYQVRSSSSSTTHNKTPNLGFPPHTHQKTSYTVRLEAWNCECAAFAFAAFPYVPPPLSSRFLLPSGDDCGGKAWGVEGLFGSSSLPLVGEGGREEEGRWEFGGLSLDGKGERKGGDGASTVPVCKHLLACLMAERWDLVREWVGVDVRVVGKEEGAGLGVGG